VSVETGATAISAEQTEKGDPPEKAAGYIFTTKYARLYEFNLGCNDNDNVARSACQTLDRLRQDLCGHPRSAVLSPFTCCQPCRPLRFRRPGSSSEIDAGADEQRIDCRATNDRPGGKRAKGCPPKTHTTPPARCADGVAFCRYPTRCRRWHPPLRTIRLTIGYAPMRRSLARVRLRTVKSWDKGSPPSLGWNIGRGHRFKPSCPAPRRVGESKITKRPPITQPSFAAYLFALALPGVVRPRAGTSCHRRHAATCCSHESISPLTFASPPVARRLCRRR
jgi:hypothetical protein